MMYGYVPDEPTNIYAVLGQYDQEEIFKIALGEYPVFGKRIKSPLRGNDTKPGCYFEWRQDRLYFVDFADTMINRDAIQFIKDFYNLPTIVDATVFIVNYFSDNSISPYTNRNLEEIVPEKYRKRSAILFQSRHFNDKDRLFWAQFKITKAQLKEDDVFPLAQYTVYSPRTEAWHITQPYGISYAIGGFDGRVKIYNPYNKAKNGKWITNCTENDVGGISVLPQNGDILIITKSYKDWRVIKNEGYNAVWFQNEGMHPTDHTLLDLLLRFSNIFILFDNDNGGIKATLKIKDKFAALGKEVNSFTSPYDHLKDPADIISFKNKKTLTQFLWENCHQKSM